MRLDWFDYILTSNPIQSNPPLPLPIPFLLSSLRFVSFLSFRGTTGKATIQTKRGSERTTLSRRCYDVVFSLMKFFRKLAGFLGLANHDHDHDDDKHDADEQPDGQPRTTPYRVHETGLPRRGFSVPAQVVVDRPQLGPVITPSTSGDGGVQGLRWYAKSLKIDEDGDVADEFLDEVSSESSSLAVDPHKSAPRFKLNHSARPVKVKKQILSDGKLQHYVEHQGRLQWV